jgi:hypothetical protein
MNYGPFSVLEHDPGAGSWAHIQAPMRRFLRSPSLLECRGRLLLAAAVDKSKLNVPRSIRIWGLQASRAAWAELERMPQPLYDDVVRLSRGADDNDDDDKPAAFQCTGHGNHILIILPGSPHMLLYHLYDKVWRWAPTCPFDTSHLSSSSSSSSASQRSASFQAFPYDPRIDALVC